MSKKNSRENMEPYILFEKSPNKDTDYMQGHFLDKIVFTSCKKILNTAQKHSIDFDDLYKPPKEITYAYASPKIENFVKQNNKKPKNRRLMFRTLTRLTNSYHYNIGFFFSIIPFLLQIPVPILVKKTIEWISDKKAESKEGYLLALILSLISFFTMFFELWRLYYVCIAYDGAIVTTRVKLFK